MYITRSVLLPCWCEHLVSNVLRKLDCCLSKCYNVKMFYPFPPKLVSSLELPSIYKVTFVETLGCIHKSVAQRCLCRGAKIGTFVILGFSVLSFLACLFQPNFYKGTTLNLEWVAPPPPLPLYLKM